MPDEARPSPPLGGQFLVYQTEDGKLKLDVRFEGETVWLTQQHMAELFQTTKQNVSLHIQNIFSEGELRADSVVKESLTTAADGKNYATKFYNLDVMTNWRGAVVRKQDVVVAKNYLSEPELAALNNLVEQYLIFAEGQAMRRVPMHMGDWIDKLDGFLTLNDRDILTHAGRISHEMAQKKAELEYDKYQALTATGARPVDADFERAVKDLPNPARKPRKKKQ